MNKGKLEFKNSKTARTLEPVYIDFFSEIYKGKKQSKNKAR